MANATVIALHCSLGSGRQWSKLAEQLGPGHDVIAPDIAGYGDNRGGHELPVTLTEEIAALGGIMNVRELIKALEGLPDRKRRWSSAKARSRRFS